MTERPDENSRVRQVSIMFHMEDGAFLQKPRPKYGGSEYEATFVSGPLYIVRTQLTIATYSLQNHQNPILIVTSLDPKTLPDEHNSHAA